MVPLLQSVVLYQGEAPWMLKWEVAGCLLTMYNNGWKSAHAISVQLFNQLRIEILDCLLLPTNAFVGGMRRTRVDRDRAHHPCVALEGGSGSGVRRYGGKGFQWHWGLSHAVVQDTLTVTISIKHLRR